MKKLISMREALEDPRLFGRLLGGPSWAAWRVLLIASMGEELRTDELATFKELTGRAVAPCEPVDEFYAIVGRRGGKTRAVAALGLYLASCVDYTDVLAPGEVGLLAIMSVSVWQSRKVRDYIEGAIATVPFFRRLEPKSSGDLISFRFDPRRHGRSGAVDIECRPASFRTIRSATLIGLIADEVCFWRNEASRNPDVEIFHAARPGLATTGGPLVAISSAYAKRGAVYQAWRDHFGQDIDPGILVAHATSQRMNPTLSDRVVNRAYDRDPVAAASEYGSAWRDDIQAYIDVEFIERLVVKGRTELPPAPGIRYVAFCDPAGGNGKDSFAFCVAHADRQHSPPTVVIDKLVEIRPPFDPDHACAELAEACGAYRVREVTGDRFAGSWVQSRVQVHGIRYRVSDKDRSAIYAEALPLLTACRVELPDAVRLSDQLCSLERRCLRGSGKEIVDHPDGPNQHDDLANVACGAMILASARPKIVEIPPGLLARVQAMNAFPLRFP